MEFEHFLAAKLGRTVAEMRRDVSAAEFVRWQMFYARDAQRRQLAAMKAG